MGLEALILGTKDRVGFDTNHGALVTERMGDWYRIELELELKQG